MPFGTRFIAGTLQAIEKNDLELVRFYLNSKVGPNYQHPEFMDLSLSECIRYNNPEIAKLLLSFGANAYTREIETGITPV